jgi:tripartite-type tricarboxylate transporter receptor subunit TctC
MKLIRKTGRPSALRRTALLCAAAMALGAGSAAWAQEAKYPTRPIKLIVATAAGGNSDLMARMIGDKLGAAWGQTVVVEQRVGANGMIAAQFVAKSPPDGYTVYLTLSSIVQNMLLQPMPGYKIEEFAPVTMLISIPIALAIGGNVPVNTVSDLMKLAKDKPGSVSYGSYGTGSGAHIIGSALARAADVNLVHVPYKGEAASYTDLVSGQLTAAFGSAGFYAVHLASGKVKLLAITGQQRMTRFPNVPTMAEAGYPGANLPGWAGLVMPAGTPEPIVSKFATEVRKILAMPDVRSRLGDMGFVPVGNTSQEFAQYLKTEATAWSTIIKENNIKLD